MLQIQVEIEIGAPDQLTDLTSHLIPGEMNTLVLQVVDITGQGGIWKPIYLAVDE